MSHHSVKSCRIQPDRYPETVSGNDGPDGTGSADIDRTTDSPRIPDPDGTLYQRGTGWGPDSVDVGPGCGRGGSEI